MINQNLLRIASRANATVDTYVQVEMLSNEEKWQAGFQGELENTAAECALILSENNGASFALHPILVGLSIVMTNKEALYMITDSHPHREEHEFYHPDAEFPDISNLLPPSADRWWERLVEDAHREVITQMALEDAQVEAEAEAPIQPKTTGLKVRIPPRPARPEAMVVDEEPEARHSKSRGRPKAAGKKAAGASKKQKGSSVGHSTTRHTWTKSHAPAEQTSRRSSSDPDEQHEDFEGKLKIQCQRCATRQVECVVDPIGPRQWCATRKEGCSLMPINPNTGKTNHHAVMAETLRKFRINQAKVSLVEVKRGKRRARDSPDAYEQEGSELEPLPALSSLANLKKLTLGGGRSSPGSTPADSPANIPQPPLLEHPLAARPSASAPKARKCAKPSPSKFTFKPPVADPIQHLTDPTIEVPMLLEPAHRQASRSSGNALPARDNQILNNTERIALIEAKLESMQQDFDSRLKKLGG